MGNSIICLSGGLDSATALALREKEVKKCVFFDYGSKQNNREEIASYVLAEHYKKEWIKIDVSKVFKDFDSALLKHSKEEIQKGPYDDIEVSNAKVPFRNGIFIAMLVGLAESFGLSKVIVGVHAGDHRLYSDCTPQFIGAFNRAVVEYSGNTIEIDAPFLNSSKAEIASMAYSLKLPIELTYSCYNGGEFHCGECPTCIERQGALGANDPTIYASFPKEIISREACEKVLKDRAKIYGDNSFKSHSEQLAKFMHAVDDAESYGGTFENMKSVHIKDFFRSMLAHKAHRFYQGANIEDSAIDFVNYLSLAKDAGIPKPFSFKDTGTYKNAKEYNAFLCGEISIDEVIRVINLRGGI